MRAVDIMSIAGLWPIKRGRRAVGPFRVGTQKRWQKTPNSALPSTVRRSYHSVDASPAAAAERDTPAIIGLEGYYCVVPSSVLAQKKSMASPLASYPRVIVGADTIVRVCQHGYLRIRFRAKG